MVQVMNIGGEELGYGTSSGGLLLSFGQEKRGLHCIGAEIMHRKGLSSWNPGSALTAGLRVYVLYLCTYYLMK